LIPLASIARYSDGSIFFKPSCFMDIKESRHQAHELSGEVYSLEIGLEMLANESDAKEVECSRGIVVPEQNNCIVNDGEMSSANSIPGREVSLMW